MTRTVALRGVPILALSIVLAACGQVNADQPSADPVPSSPPVSHPSEQPSQEPAKPVATPKPVVVVKHELPMIGRVTHDGVAVRNLPDLQSGIVDGNDPDDRIVENIRLRIGDEVLVMNGPILADGYSWYEVVATAIGPAEYFRGFMAGEFLTRAGGEQGFGKVASVDGQGFNASASGYVHAASPLTVFLGVTTMDGDASCRFELVIVGTDGQRIEIVPETEIGEATIGQVSAGNLESLYMETAGHVTVDVTSDCSFAVMVNIPAG